jgi:hypothetical protein
MLALVACPKKRSPWSRIRRTNNIGHYFPTHDQAAATGQGPFNAAFVLDGMAVPGPVAGAGLPALVVACGCLVALSRRRRKMA